MSQPGCPRPVTRRLPVVAAWAVLGAAAGVALMWAPPVFDGRPGEWPDWEAFLAHGGVHYSGPTYSAGRVRVLGVTAYAETYAPPGDGERAVGRWHRRTAAGLALVGGLAGVAVGWRLGRGRTGSPLVGACDWRLGLAVAAGVFMLVGAAGVPGAPGRPLFDDFPDLGPKDWTERATAFAWGAAGLCVPALAVGWAAQVVAGAWGLRLPPGRLPDQAADYDDAVVASPEVAPDRRRPHGSGES